MPKKAIIFVSTMWSSPWGGSEELWSQAALNLVARGVPVAASVYRWSPPHKRVLDLLQAGVKLQQRYRHPPIWMRAWRTAISSKGSLTLDLERFLAANPPALVVLSNGGPMPTPELMEMCVREGWRFVAVAQQNSESFWPDDELGERYQRVLPAALRCFFVSRANKLLAEKQFGYEFANAEVVRNPYGVSATVSLSWPTLGERGEIRLACVGRLHPSSKGQDILLEALAKPSWTTRNWRLSLYGDGPAKKSLAHLVKRLNLSERVDFAGYVPVEEIWASNHVLVMPSRYEGLPLALVEAMMCARPVIATDVGGNSEIIEDGVTGFLAKAPTVASMAEALERGWARRAEFEEIGLAAAKSIRKIVPADPVDIFSRKLQEYAI